MTATSNAHEQTTQHEPEFAMNTMLRAALDYAARGLPVFPCNADKRPLVKGGFKKATTDQDQIIQWWTQWPDAMIGMPTGKASGIDVIDIDVHDGKDGFAGLKALGKDWRKLSNVVVRTPTGGAHLWIKSDGTLRNSTGKVAPGVDIRGKDGYVIVPPSSRNGSSYKFEEGGLDDLDKLPAPAHQEEPEPEAKSGDPEANIEQIRIALEVIPNGDLGWDDWNKIAMAAWHASKGGEEAFEAFDRWSRKAQKYDERTTRQRWNEITRSPPDKLGAGTLFWHADQADPDWRSRGWRLIKVRPGQLARIVEETEDALLAAKQPVLQRAGALVTPVPTERPVSKRHGSNQKTVAVVLRQLFSPSLSLLLNRARIGYLQWNKKDKGFVPVDAPGHVLRAMLESGRWKFPHVAGVITTPSLRPDGKLLVEPGYDKQTELWHEQDPSLVLPPLKDAPTREDALAALDKLKGLLTEYPFVTGTDRSVALAAIITAVVRAAFDLCPMFYNKAHEAGSGKSHLVDLVSAIVRGRDCPVIAPGKDEEFEKQLGALLFEGLQLVSLDNCNRDFDNKLLCQMTTQTTVKVRRLGESQAPECEWRGVLLGTGNNVGPSGDMVRRTLVCNLDPAVERPEMREFNGDPIRTVMNDRGAYVAAALTVVRAYVVAGKPDLPSPVGGYGGWSEFVRAPLLWLGEPDPWESTESSRAEDPARAQLAAVIEAWRATLQVGVAYKAADIIKVAKEGAAEEGGQTTTRNDELKDALLAVASAKGKADILDAVRLGFYLKKQNGRVYRSGDGTLFRIARNEEKTRDHAVLWVLQQLGGAQQERPVQRYEPPNLADNKLF